MPKTLGEWLFLVIIGLFSFLWASNLAIAILFFSGSLVMGYREGFDVALVVLSFIFGFLVIGEFTGLLSTLSGKPEKILRSLWPNLLAVVVRSTYLCFAGLISYGVLSGGLTKYYWPNLGIVVIITIVNFPLFAFHSLLCFSKFRQRLLEMENRFRNLTVLADNKAD